jgi:epoxide hydrolase 4
VQANDVALGGATREVLDVTIGEVTLRCAIEGPAAGALVLLLHGFPECAASWHLVQRGLARRGFRVVAPDMRGYGGSSKPAGVSAYAVPRLVADVEGLARALGSRRAHVVGHDWGAVVAWWTAMLRPELVDRLAIVNGPHPVAYAAALRTAAQLRRAWYVFFFQLPWLPEWVLARRNYAAVRDYFRKDGISDDEIEPCVAALRQAGARSAAVNYYRASLRGAVLGTGPKPARIDRPTLVVWGEKDRFLVPALAEPPSAWVPDARVVRLEDASHWAHIDAAGRVVEELARHFPSAPQT